MVGGFEPQRPGSYQSVLPVGCAGGPNDVWAAGYSIVGSSTAAARRALGRLVLVYRGRTANRLGTPVGHLRGFSLTTSGSLGRTELLHPWWSTGTETCFRYHQPVWSVVGRAAVPGCWAGNDRRVAGEGRRIALRRHTLWSGTFYVPGRHPASLVRSPTLAWRGWAVRDHAVVNRTVWPGTSWSRVPSASASKGDSASGGIGRSAQVRTRCATTGSSNPTGDLASARGLSRCSSLRLRVARLVSDRRWRKPELYGQDYPAAPGKRSAVKPARGMKVSRVRTRLPALCALGVLRWARLSSSLQRPRQSRQLWFPRLP